MAVLSTLISELLTLGYHWQGWFAASSGRECAGHFSGRSDQQEGRCRSEGRIQKARWVEPCLCPPDQLLPLYRHQPHRRGIGTPHSLNRCGPRRAPLELPLQPLKVGLADVVKSIPILGWVALDCDALVHHTLQSPHDVRDVGLFHILVEAIVDHFDDGKA